MSNAMDIYLFGLKIDKQERPKLDSHSGLESFIKAVFRISSDYRARIPDYRHVPRLLENVSDYSFKVEEHDNNDDSSQRLYFYVSIPDEEEAVEFSMKL